MTAAAQVAEEVQVTAVAQSQSLAWELPYAEGMAIKLKGGGADFDENTPLQI